MTDPLATLRADLELLRVAVLGQPATRDHKALQLDLSTVLDRIQRIAALPTTDRRRNALIDHLIHTDAPRLRAHLTPEWITALDGGK